MAYFPNGTAGMIYEDRYCCRCKNQRDLGDGRGHGCAIWDLHLFYSYEECNNDGTVEGKPKTNAKAMLDYLIPHDADGFPAECSMFLEKTKAEADTEKLVASMIPTAETIMPCMAAWAKQRGVIA